MGALLSDPAAALRPAPTTWSAVEYGCHVRDVLRRFDTRLGLMLDEDDPLFANWDQDATAVDDGYSTQEATIVARELTDAAAKIAARFDELGDPATPEAGAVWRRVGRRSDGAVFTVETFARYFLHDPVHHLWDIELGYTTINS